MAKDKIKSLQDDEGILEDNIVYEKVKVKDIIVGDRYRKDFGDIEELAISIQRFGLLNPITIDENNKLIAGERRLRAHEFLGLKEIEVRRKSKLDDVQKREIELDENLKRKNFSWPELIMANKELFHLRQRLYGKRTQGKLTEGYGVEDHAVALDRSESMVSQDLQLADAILEFPELMKEKSKTKAYNKYKKMATNLFVEEYARRHQKDTPPNIIHGDSFKVTSEMESNKFDFIITDPPFAVDADKRAKEGDRKGPADPGYRDDPHKVMENIRKTCGELYRVLKDNRHMIIAFAMEHYLTLYNILTEIGFWVEPTPLIWNKTTGSTPSNGKFFPFAYEPAFWCMKGSRDLFTTNCNVFTFKRVPANYKYHPFERPQGLMEAWVKAVSYPDELGYDCYAGGGSFMEACITTKRRCIVVEKSKEHYNSILRRYKDLEEGGKGV